MMTAHTLSSHDVFSFLRPKQVNAISDVAEVVSIAAGETVFRSGEPAVSLFAVLEGHVSLRLPRAEGVNLQIEEVSTGALFGSCVCFDLSTYTLTAICPVDSTLLKINAASLKRIMDDDLAVGYPLQRMISRTYFKRYVDTMNRLRSIAESLALRVE